MNDIKKMHLSKLNVWPEEAVVSMERCLMIPGITVGQFMNMTNNTNLIRLLEVVTGMSNEAVVSSIELTYAKIEEMGLYEKVDD